MNSLNFLLNENVFILPPYWGIFSMDIESWVDRFLPFSFLMVLFSFFWSSQFLMRSLWSFESLFLYAMCLFSLAAFKVFSLSLIFSSFNMSTCVNLCLSLDLESEVVFFFFFLPFIFQRTFCSILLLSF